MIRQAIDRDTWKDMTLNDGDDPMYIMILVQWTVHKMGLQFK